MDKTEYRMKLDEIGNLVDAGDYEGAFRITETIDWRKVKSIRTLCTVADIYEANGKLEDCRQILLLAYDRATKGKSILYRLVEVALKMGSYDDAVDYYQEFIDTAPNDNSRYILKYKIYKAKRSPIEDLIAILEEYKSKEYTERWAYELARLYSKAGMREKCIEECDDLILWFSEGKYVFKAMELKMKYEPLSASQRQIYDSRQELMEQEKHRVVREAALQDIPEVKNPSPVTVRSVVPEAAASREKSPEKTADSKQPQGGIDLSSVLEGTLEEVATSTHPQPAAMPDPKELQERLSKSFKDVFAGFSRPEEPASEEPKETPEEFSEDEIPVVKELEPEQKETDVIPKIDPKKKVEITAAVEKKPAKEEPKAEESSSTEDFDLEAILKETAGSMAQELATGNFEKNEVDMPETVQTSEDFGKTRDIAEAVAKEQKESAPQDTLAQAVADAIANNQLAKVIAEITVEENAQAESAFAENISEEQEQPENAQLEMDIPVMEYDQEEPQDDNVVITEDAVEVKDLEEETIPDAVVEDPIPAVQEAEESADEDDVQEESQETEQPESQPVDLMEEILRDETPEEKRLRILNDTRPEKMSEEQKKLFSYFAKVPGMNQQILDAMSGVYEHAGDKTSRRGNIAIMGGHGTGKSKLSESLVRAICQDLGLKAVKIARLDASDLNAKDPVRVVAKLSGGFLIVDRAGLLHPNTIKSLSKAMDFRTDGLTIIIEDEKTSMRTLLKNYPEFAEKFATVISIPVFTNDELVTFARVYATEMGFKIDDMGVLALYTLIGDNQSESEPITILKVKEMVDNAISKAQRGTRKLGRKVSRKHLDDENRVILYEKDFDF